MNRTVFCLVIFLLLSNLPSIAQGSSDEIVYAEKSKKYRKMKNRGAALTIFGGVLAVTGMGTMLNSLDISAPDQSDRYQTGEFLFVVGGVSLGPGIPLWIVGTRNQRYYSRNLESSSVRLDVYARNNGITLRYRF
jgi:hypothetical protein